MSSLIWPDINEWCDSSLDNVVHWTMGNDHISFWNYISLSDGFLLQTNIIF